MCGIVGYIGKKAHATAILMDGLHRLEYRGYDSAGIAVHTKQKVQTFRSVGKVTDLDKKIAGKKLAAYSGIAHTRWATHGKPDTSNAHPHHAGKIHLVHNGIIENYRELRENLMTLGHTFTSETDSEVIAHLIEQENKKYDFDEAVRRAVMKLHGAYALVILHDDEPDKLIALRQSSPLVFGIGTNEYILASDAAAIVAHTKTVIYLEDGDLLIATHEGYHIENNGDKKITRKQSQLTWNHNQAQKDGYDHFMLKEIYEQPHAITDSLRGRTDTRRGMVILDELDGIAGKLAKAKRITIVSCGTSYHAGLVARYMFEQYANIPTVVEHASEYRYRDPCVDKHTVVIVISQSGETADTREAVRESKERGAITIGIVNSVGSTIARETDAVIYTYAGPEISVASTKAFTTQLSVLAMLAVYLGRQRGLSEEGGQEIIRTVRRIPRQMREILAGHKHIQKIAKKYATYDNFFYLGRKYSFPIALEGALKIKEISYVHAEGYAAGEMKHGPIALIDDNFPTVIIAPRDSVYEKTVSAVEELHARSGKVIIITTEGSEADFKSLSSDVITVPQTMEMLMPLVTIVPLQLFAYYVGVARGHNVDQPRNLAKSVTVE